MSTNPLFPDNPVRPETADDAAVQLIRAKVNQAYGEEPSAQAELAEVARERVLSKHQQFMQNLARAGKSLVEIQTEWHRYYTTLPDEEKREVWEEFYAANQHTPYQKLFQKQQPVATRTALTPPPAVEKVSALELPTVSPHITTTDSGVTIADHQVEHTLEPRKPRKRPPSKTIARLKQTKIGREVANSQTAEATRRIKQRIQHKVSAGGKLRARHHMQSLLFGLGMGGIVLLILLFSFFNEFIIAPFIQPSRNVSATPIIVSSTAAQSAQPTVIVPKINIQIPVDFNLTSNKEATVQKSLENGVVHYSGTALPGQNGNGAYFGHSSSNIFNNGKYKFAFVLLRELTTGDIFYITNGGKVYAYQVFAKEIVPPTQVSVLGDTKGEIATAVLITCDPPGFSTNRLVVWGKQISPSVATNTAPPTQDQNAHPVEIASNGPTLWTRMWRTIVFWD